MRILVIVTGGLGGYFGACLARAGRDVTFLAAAARGATLIARMVYPDTMGGIRDKALISGLRRGVASNGCRTLCTGKPGQCVGRCSLVD